MREDETTSVPDRAALKQRVGLRQVAAVAGVSTATVSRVVNRPETVSEPLRTRVNLVIDKLGWVPNAAARTLSSNRSGAIGAIFPALVGDLSRAIDAMQDVLGERNLMLLLARSQYDPDTEFRQARKLVERGVDGLILVGRTRTAAYEEFLRKVEIPFVNSFVFDEVAHGPCVGPDNAVAMGEAVDYLHGLGHRRFALISHSMKNNDRATMRLVGVKRALERHGLAIPPHHILEGNWSISEGRRIFRQVIASDPSPTALLFGNSLLTVGAVLEAAAMGVRIPEEISIIGHDDTEIMAELPIPISTVRVAADDVGSIAARLVVDMVEGLTEVKGYRISSELIIRATTGPAPAR
jgi:LacI family transcriptional regulator